MTETASDDHYYTYKVMEEGGGALPRIEYFDLGGDNVTPTPLYVPEPNVVATFEKQEKHKAKTHSVMHTFMKMAGAVYAMSGLGSIEESKMFRDKFEAPNLVDTEKQERISSYQSDDLDSLAAEAEAALMRGSSTSRQATGLDQMKAITREGDLELDYEPKDESAHEALPAKRDCHINILLKETETLWMLILTGTCAEIEGNEQLQISGRKKATQDAETETKSEEKQTKTEEAGTTTEDATKPTEGTGDDEAVEKSEEEEKKPDEEEEKEEEKKEEKSEEKKEEKEEKKEAQAEVSEFISHKYDLTDRWSQTIDFPRKKKGCQSDMIVTSDTGSQVVSKDLLFR